MPRQPKLRPKTNIPGLPVNLYNLTAVAQLSELECQQEMEEKPQRVFRVKRKHVLKACDRCRIKKTKVSTFFCSAPGLYNDRLDQVRWKATLQPLRCI